MIRRFFKLLKLRKRYLTDFYRTMREFYFFNMTPAKQHIFNNNVFRHEGHYNWAYKEWTMRRINKVLDIFGVDWFSGKKLLVLGDGIGNIGAFFADIDAKVLSLEAQRENVNIAKLKYKNLKNFEIVQFDLRKDFTQFGNFDLIINFGLIEVMDEIDNLLQCCMKMSDKILVETIVIDSLLDKKIKVSMGKKIDHGLSEFGTWCSPSCIEKYFETNGFNTRRFFDKDLNLSDRYYDWEHGIKIKKEEELRRFWLFEKEDKNA